MRSCGEISERAVLEFRGDSLRVVLVVVVPPFRESSLLVGVGSILETRCGRSV